MPVYAFREGYTAVKGRYDVAVKDERGRGAALTDNLALFHKLFAVSVLFKGLKKKNTNFGVH